ncbi:voltage-gated monoatomic cation channel TMEM109 [Latimeria chalumnae]|uniref:Transmembrane protein 109 n=1 Tax=Latimeria chalumnae TaxID=7897 RepID=H2ZS63_LATCH|nr:PREDICTED: transmembrane protein 109 [Latimeria chalumnae]|eukprot:XP_006010221.1 PREDICTED: transmembrane protein 109 [Latimeria chalumnae]
MHSQSFVQIFLPLLALALLKGHAADVKFVKVESSESTQGQASFVQETGRAVLEGLEQVLGKELLQRALEFLTSCSEVIADGLSAGLRTLYRFANDGLRALGVEGERFTHFLNLSSQEVHTLLIWGAVALIGYWLFSFLLHLILSVVGRVFWLLKIGLFLSAFVYIITAYEDPARRATLLLVLLVVYVLLGRFCSSSESEVHYLRDRVRSLEGEVNNINRNMEQRAGRKK